ncbi:MAG: sugar phosphate isomerase/epimerase, partial [Ruminococcaceae bacterium]|nr:sugar phosphate isomerase/epimerase [Oscillospiraceae bacterium]
MRSCISSCRKNGRESTSARITQKPPTLRKAMYAEVFTARLQYIKKAGERMLLSTETSSVIKRFGQEKAFAMLKRSGFDACDFSFYGEGAELLGDDCMENARKTKELLDTAGLLCNQAHAPFDLSEGEAFDLSCRNYRAIVRSIEYAAYLGAKKIVVHLIVTADREAYYAYNQRYYKSLEFYGKQFGIKIAVENDFERRNGKVLPILNDPQEYVDFIRELDSEWLVGCIDIGHAAMFQDPAEFIEKTGGRIVKALHIHDNDLHE